jgi:membrane-associated phospholipid phosphatase
MRNIAVALSYILHPVFMLTYLTSYFLFSVNYFSYFMSPVRKLFLLSAVFIFSAILPLLNTFALKKLGYIKNLHMSEPTERLLPYISTLILNSGLLYVLHDLPIPFFYKYLIIVSIAVLAVLLLLNFFLKVSAHTMVMGGCLGVLLFYEYVFYSSNSLVLCICLFLAGLTGFARLFLGAHKPVQVYTGYIAGLLTGILCLFLLTLFNF